MTDPRFSFGSLPRSSTTPDIWQASAGPFDFRTHPASVGGTIPRASTSSSTSSPFSGSTTAPGFSTPVKSEKPASAPASIEKSKSQIFDDDDEDLVCSICSDVPEHQVYQCTEGHLFCNECYTKMMQLKFQCAICRGALDRNKPIRNRLAERKILLLPAVCKNQGKGCTERVNRGNVKQHEDKECQYRDTFCDATPIGCVWKGVVKDVAEHQKTCLYAKALPLVRTIKTNLEKKVLTQEQAVNQKLELLEQKLLDLAERQTKLSGKSPAPKFNRSFDFCLQTSPLGWIQHFNAFGILWEVSLMVGDGMGIKLKPSPAEPRSDSSNTHLGTFTIALECLHPSSDSLRACFKYTQVQMSSVRYLEEHCFMSQQQMRFFVKPNGDVKINIKIKKLA